jgi:hypothetical protein
VIRRHFQRRRDKIAVVVMIGGDSDLNILGLNLRLVVAKGVDGLVASIGNKDFVAESKVLHLDGSSSIVDRDETVAREANK